MTVSLPLQARLLERGLSEVPAADWNRLVGEGMPYLRHEFLLAMETQGCLGEYVGWLPRHLLLEDTRGRLLGALPQYVKLNSFGEFVFDWAWAEAYQRAGLDYYPKLVVAPPFTPATGPRLLLDPDLPETSLSIQLIDAAIAAAESMGASSVHWLFATDASLNNSPLLMQRSGCQFHWANRAYENFDAFLAELTAKRRKEILRERRQVREAGVELVQLPGDEVSSQEWRTFHALYRHTFDKHGNYPALTLGFFEEVAATMGEQIRLVVARRQGQMIGAAYFLVGQDCLYGRYWGAREEIPGLHFEACYYQGIEYCIERGLQRFEPGAQGEHKISRGFLPTRTWSYHWISHPGFRAPIADFLQRESLMMDDYHRRLMEKSPFKFV
jgi:predicted N-acyltransferase